VHFEKLLTIPPTFKKAKKHTCKFVRETFNFRIHRRGKPGSFMIFSGQGIGVRHLKLTSRSIPTFDCTFVQSHHSHIVIEILQQLTIDRHLHRSIATCVLPFDRTFNCTFVQPHHTPQCFACKEVHPLVFGG